jgi:hypothetical protein
MSGHSPESSLNWTEAQSASAHQAAKPPRNRYAAGLVALLFPADEISAKTFPRFVGKRAFELRVLGCRFGLASQNPYRRSAKEQE